MNRDRQTHTQINIRKKKHYFKIIERKSDFKKSEKLKVIGRETLRET